MSPRGGGGRGGRGSGGKGSHGGSSNHIGGGSSGSGPTHIGGGSGTRGGSGGGSGGGLGVAGGAAAGAAAGAGAGALISGPHYSSWGFSHDNGHVPSHDSIPGQSTSTVSDKDLPPNAESDYPRRIRNLRPAFIRGPNQLHISEDCRLDDRYVEDAAEIQIEGTSDKLKGVSWSEGVAKYRTGDDTHVVKSFYLGVEEGMNATDTGSCAVFFTNVTDNVAFVGEDKKGPHGSCDWAMDDKCVAAMIKRAEQIKTNGSVKETCDRLGEEFKKNLDKECERYAGSKWDGLVVKELSDHLASKNAIKKNSKCWLAESDKTNLSLVASINEKVPTLNADDLNDPTRDLIRYGVTPILSFFYPGDGKLISKPEAHMTCIKPVAQGEDNSVLQTSSASPDTEPNTGAASLGPRAWDAGLLVLTFWLMMALLGIKTRAR